MEPWNVTVGSRPKKFYVQVIRFHGPITSLLLAQFQIQPPSARGVMSLFKGLMLQGFRHYNQGFTPNACSRLVRWVYNGIRWLPIVFSYGRSGLRRRPGVQANMAKAATLDLRLTPSRVCRSARTGRNHGVRGHKIVEAYNLRKGVRFARV